MNRREEPISARARKKIKKQIRILVDTKEPVSAPRNLHGQTPAKRPRKVIVQEISQKKALLKKMEIAKKKRHSLHRSKRVSPGSVEERPSPPSEIHKEGKRWIQTIEKQNINKAERLFRKLSKKR
jgi:hypothetical protein